MAFGIFIHNSNSDYADIPHKQYQFPKHLYLKRVEQCVGDWIIYLRSRRSAGVKNWGYFALARVTDIIDDPNKNDNCLALIQEDTYLEFDNLVHFQSDDGSYPEQSILNKDGTVSQGRRQGAVRIIPSADFNRIIKRGIGSDNDLIPITDNKSASENAFEEDTIPFNDEYFLSRTNEIIHRLVRGQHFRRNVLKAYNKRCAMTGLSLINGGGHPEVEAAHIKPVKDEGPDNTDNGIALSRTVHWMFDRGLISFNINFDILVSRYANDPDTIWAMLNKTRKILLPLNQNNWPNSDYIEWHNKNCFKS